MENHVCIPHPKGSLLGITGHFQNRVLQITHHEALFLADRHSLALHTPSDDVISSKEGYACCMQNTNFISSFQIYGYLRRLGFILDPLSESTYPPSHTPFLSRLKHLVSSFWIKVVGAAFTLLFPEFLPYSKRFLPTCIFIFILISDLEGCYGQDCASYVKT